MTVNSLMVALKVVSLETHIISRLDVVFCLWY